jgi:hypothetical protein
MQLSQVENEWTSDALVTMLRSGFWFLVDLVGIWTTRSLKDLSETTLVSQVSFWTFCRGRMLVERLCRNSVHNRIKCQIEMETEQKNRKMWSTHISIYIYIMCIYIYMYINLYIHIDENMSVRTFQCMYVYMHTCMSWHILIWICIFTIIYIYIYRDTYKHPPTVNGFVATSRSPQWRAAWAQPTSGHSRH